MKAIKKPIEIDYYPVEEKYLDNIKKWSTKKRPIVIVSEDDKNGKSRYIKYAEITTLEGIMTANHGDVIIKGVNGEVYPCKKDIFEKTYNL